MFPVCLAAGWAPLDAAVVVDSRRTELQASTQFGFLGGINSTAPKVEFTRLTSDLQTELRGSDSGSGALGDSSWVANYEFAVEQTLEYLPAGGFSSSGSVLVFAFAADQGVASAEAGNLLELGFTVSNPENYQFTGVTTDLAKIVLERSAGAGLWTAIAEPGTGIFEYQFDLAPGQYRFSAVSGGYHNSSQGEGSAWSVQLAAVPEPAATAVAVGTVLAGMGLMRRWTGLRRSSPL